MPEQLSYQFDQPNTYDELGFIERLSLLINHKASTRDNRKVTRLLKLAKLRYNGHACDIDYRSKRGLHKDTVEHLLSLDWITKSRNVLIQGPTGTGKTFLACILGHAACEHGVRTKYIRASRLFETLTLSHDDGSYTKLLAQIAKIKLLIIDDWGLAILNQQNRNDLLEIIEYRHGNSATLITSQLPTNHWMTRLVKPPWPMPFLIGYSTTLTKSN